MPLNGYDNLINVGLSIAGLRDVGRDVREGTSVVFEAVSKGITPQRVVLRGRALPYAKVDWGVSQRVTTTFYPGNPVATQQVLGPEELPTTMEGMWKARYLENNVLVDGVELDPDPFAVVRLFSDMCRIGAVWRVTWLGEVRRGVMTSFTPTWHRQTDCGWEAVFDWAARDDDGTEPPDLGDPPGGSFDILGEINSFLDKVAAAPLVASQLVNMVIGDIRAIQETASRIVGILASAETLVSAPAQVIGSLRAAIVSLANQVNVAVRRIGDSAQSSVTAVSTLGGALSANEFTSSSESFASGTKAASVRKTVGIPAGTADKIAGGTVDPARNGQSGASGTEAAAPDDEGLVATGTGTAANTNSGAQSVSAQSGMLAFEAWRRDVVNAMHSLFFEVDRAVAGVERRNVPPILRTITTLQGDTLYSVSSREYGSPDFANWIASANNLRSAILEPGTELRIPSRPTGSSIDIVIGTGDQVGPQGSV
jgi:hypothetical protein